jgi:SAM-dependent methyltransferase
MPEMTEQPTSADHVRRNRAAWDIMAADYVGPARRNWAAAPAWGIWKVPEADLHLLPDLLGLDVVELGCGTAYVSAWLARRGARAVVGIDSSPAQLRTARLMQSEFQLEFPLIHGDAEHAPLADACADLVISEYGASIWCDPYRWIPEAARLLRPGGRLVFLVNSTLLMLVVPDEDGVPAGEQLLRDHFGMHRLEWPDDGSVEFHLGHGDWIRLLRANGFEVENLVEVRPSEEATTRYPFVTLEWSRRWPCEEVWMARRHG